MWQPIESAPRDGTKFIGFIGGAIDFFYWQELKDRDAPVGWRDSFITVFPEGSGPTHWMPLPPAPEDETK